MSAGALYRRLAALSPEQRARFTRRLEADGLADPDAEITPRPPGAAAPPASLMQQRLWLIDQMEPGSAFYNLPLLGFRLEGPLGLAEQAALAGACAELERRHEALRTSFAAVDGAPVQVIAPPRRAAPLPLADLSGLPAPAREAAAGALALAEARRPFDLAQGPLWRTRLLRLGPADHLFLVTMHHIISDAWSIGVLYRELAALYGTGLRGLPSPLPALLVQYPDFALWQRRRFAAGLLAEEIGFWRGQLAGAPELIALPTDRPRPRERSYRGRRRIFAPPEGLPEALVGLAQASGASLFMVLLSGFDALLHRVTGQDDLVLGSPVAGRNHLGTEGLIGFFVNTVVLRVRLAGELTVRQLVARVREAVLDVYEHQELPFDRLVEELQPKRSTSHSPIFQAMFSLQNIATPDLALERLQVTPQWVDNGTAQTDLILFAGAQHGRLDTLQIEYSTDLFDDATIARMERHLLNVLAAAAAAPETRLGDLPLLTAGERLQILDWSGALGSPLTTDDLEPRLERRFARWAALAPHKVAVELGAESLTYGELDRRAARLAARLRRLGVGPEVRVGLCIRRTLDMPVAIVAVLKAGGAYLPLDPEAPPERLRMLLADAAALVAITTADLAGRLAAAAARLVLLGKGDDRSEGAEEEAPATDTCEGSADHLAYVLYTSGSTGLPKGVLISHRNVLRLFAASAEHYRFTADDVWTIFHSFAFDFSMWELWGALLHGGRAVLLPASVLRSPEELLAVLCTRQVTLLSQTPAAFRGLAAALAARPEAAAGLALRSVMMAGEALLPEDLRPWFARFGDGGPLIANMFGPTEVTVHGTFRRMTPADLEQTASPIGAPFADLALHLLDGSGNPVPIGVPGEILVGGAGLARGYLGRPDLTAERFVPDPFGAALGGRLYRSGDLGRRLADGDVEYLGRIDHQVKVRGVRIELGEIEVALLRHPAVAAAAVALCELAPGESGLVAYWVPAAAGPERTSSDLLVAPRKGSTAGDLRAFLRESLPEVMVPATFVLLGALPLTVNGKLDRRALPVPERQRQAGEEYLAPATPLEETLAAVWRDLLGLDRIGVRDDFFELGGHSLLATRLASRLRDRLDVDLSAQLVFQAPTIAAMAVELERVIAAGVQAAADGVVVPRAPALVPVTRRARRSSGAGG